MTYETETKNAILKLIKEVENIASKENVATAEKLEIMAMNARAELSALTATCAECGGTNINPHRLFCVRCGARM